MTRVKKTLGIVLSSVMFILLVFSNLTVDAAKTQNQIPEIKYASAPVTEYTAGDRVRFDIYAPNYGGRVEYRVILWNDSKKTYYDLWNAGNGFPGRYYTNWQPNGNTVFTLGWPIFEPGYYRITVCVKRVGIPNSKAALKGMNCDSYMESVAFLVKPKVAEVDYIQPVGDVSVTQGCVPQLPQTVKAVMKDKTEKDLRVYWEGVDTRSIGIFIIKGNVEGTDKKAALKLIVNPAVLSIYSVTAASETCVNVVLRDRVDYIPDMSRFYILGSSNVPVRIYTDSLSQDGRVIQLVTEVMGNGKWYKLFVDGKEYSFQVPSPVINKISIREIQDLGIEAGKQGTVNIFTEPENTLLTAYSSNKNIAVVEIKDRKLIIKGVGAGTAIITITASRNGYESSSQSFNVIVNKLTTSPDSVSEDSSFDKVFQLEIKGYGTFRSDFSLSDISLDGDFEGLKVQWPNILDIQHNKLKIRLTGKLVHKNGYGTMVLNQRGWKGAYSLTSRVNVTAIKQVEKPVALPEAGEVLKNTQVVLYSPTSSSKVYFTMDGTTPTNDSTEFVKPIIIDKNIKIKAIALKTGMKDSEVSTFIYTVKDNVLKPVTIRDGEFRAVQGSVIGKPQDRVYIQQLVKQKWNTISSTNEEVSNGQLKGFFVINKTPFAVIDNIKSGLVIVTPRDEDTARITGYMDSDGEIQYGEYRAVQGNVIGEKKERVYIQKLDDGKWKTISATKGSGDNGKLTGFLVINKTPYAIIKYSDSGDIILTSRNGTLDKVAAKVTWD